MEKPTTVVTTVIDKPPADWLKAHEAITQPDTDVKSRLLAAFPTQRRPGGITIKEAADLWGISYNGAQHRLAELVRRRKMHVEKAVDGGRQVNVFYFR